MKCETKCIKTVRVGRFKISLLQQTKTFPQPEEVKDCFPEKTVEDTRVAIQHGVKKGEKWVNQTIYCSAQDFRSLQAAIDDFIDQSDDNQEGEQPSVDDQAGETE